MSAVVLRPGEGELIGGGPTAVTIKATGADTGESFYLGKGLVQPGFPVRRHTSTTTCTTCSTCSRAR